MWDGQSPICSSIPKEKTEAMKEGGTADKAIQQIERGPLDLSAQRKPLLRSVVLFGTWHLRPRTRTHRMHVFQMKWMAALTEYFSTHRSQERRLSRSASSVCHPISASAVDRRVVNM